MNRKLRTFLISMIISLVLITSSIIVYKNKTIAEDDSLKYEPELYTTTFEDMEEMGMFDDEYNEETELDLLIHLAEHSILFEKAMDDLSFHLEYPYLTDNWLDETNYLIKNVIDITEGVFYGYVVTDNMEDIYQAYSSSMEYCREGMILMREAINNDDEGIMKEAVENMDLSDEYLQESNRLLRNFE